MFATRHQIFIDISILKFDVKKLDFIYMSCLFKPIKIKHSMVDLIDKELS